MNSEAAYYAMVWWPRAEHARVLAVLETLARDHASRWAPLVHFIDAAVIGDAAWDADVRVRAGAPLQLAPCDMMAWCRGAPGGRPVDRVMRFAAITWGMACHWIRDTPLRREACAQETPWAKSLRAVLLRLDQAKDIMWWFIRRFWVGASNLAGILRMQDAWMAYTPYAEWRTPVHVWAEITGRIDKEPFPIDGKRAAEHGKLMEGLPRDLCAAEFPDHDLIEVGSIIVRDAPMGVYTQSPDGLIVPRGTVWPWGLDRDPTDPAVHAYDDALLASVVTVCEFKCQWLKRHAYTRWPDGYMAQIAQAMRAFRVRTARVCAVYYVPSRACPLFGEYWLRGHREDRCEWMSRDILWDDAAMAWFAARLDEFAHWIAHGDDPDAVQRWHLDVVVATGRTPAAPDDPAVPAERTKGLCCSNSEGAPAHLGAVGPHRHVMDAMTQVATTTMDASMPQRGGRDPWRDMPLQAWADLFSSTFRALDARYAIECRLKKQQCAATCSPTSDLSRATLPFPEAHSNERM